MEKTQSDLAIWVSECLKEVDGIDIEWGAIHEYIHGFLDDNKLELELKKR